MQDGLPPDWDCRQVAERYRPGLAALAIWLAEATRPPVLIKVLFPEFCEQVARTLVPIFRVSLGIEVLHPEISGTMLVWTDSSIEFREGEQRQFMYSPNYMNSPVRIVDDTDRPWRHRLDADSYDMPLLQELRDMGGTDYYIMPLPFLDTSRTRILSFATRHAGGFDVDDLAALDMAARLLSPYVEREMWKRTAVDLLDTYVGHRTSRLIVEGRIDRGDVDWI